MNTYSKKKKWGGARPNSGPKTNEEKLVLRGLKEKINNHIEGVVDITVVDKSTGKTKVEEKIRAIAIMEMLFQEAYARKNISAAKEWLDRALGKAPQGIEHSGEIKQAEQRIPTKAEMMAAQSYAQILKEEIDKEKEKNNKK